MKNIILMFAFGFALIVATYIFFDFITMDTKVKNRPVAHTLGKYIPYDGYLELDGEPVFGSETSLRFTVYDEVGALWSEEKVVNINNGNFGVLLGQKLENPPAAFYAKEVYVGVEIKTNERWVILEGIQHTNTIPFSIWATRGAQVVVEGELYVAYEDLNDIHYVAKNLGHNRLARNY